MTEKKPDGAPDKATEESKGIVYSRKWLRECTSYEYLRFCIDIGSKSQNTIAREMGFRSQASVAQMAKGIMPISLDRVYDLAAVVHCDPLRLREKVMRERFPKLAEQDKQHGLCILTPLEMQVIESFRKNADKIEDQKTLNEEQAKTLKDAFGIIAELG